MAAKRRMDYGGIESTHSISSTKQKRRTSRDVVDAPDVDLIESLETEVVAGIMIICPKPFERDAFMRAVGVEKFSRLRMIRDGKQYEMIKLEIELKGVKVEVNLMTVDKSDIEFLIAFYDILRVFRPEHCILLGTCMSYGKHGLGESFKVGKAIKFDRGTMSVNATGKYEVEFNIEKRLVSEHSMRGNSFTTVGSSNYLSYVEARRVFETGSVDFLDMETYEFFKICEMLGLSSYSCFRIVSDIYHHGKTPEEMKMERKNVDFRNVVGLVLDEIESLVYMMMSTT